MMGVLFRIGQSLDAPSVILDYYKADSKPSYDMASEYPLILWDCAFDGPEDAYPGNLTPPIRVEWEAPHEKSPHSAKKLQSAFFNSVQDYMRKGRAASLMYSGVKYTHP